MTCCDRLDRDDRVDRVGTRFMTGEKAGQLGLGPG